MLCNKNVTSSIRLVVSMDIFDSTGRVTDGTIEMIAEQILQTTTTGLSRLIKLGVKYELDTIHGELESKRFLVLLRRTYSRRPGRTRRLLLVAYFDETVAMDKKIGTTFETFSGNVSTVVGSSTSVGSDFTTWSSSTHKSPGNSFPIAPLKRKMDSITLITGDGGSPTKKQLTFNDDDSECAQGVIVGNASK
ncbi:hypothetical protein LIER_24962 [Lithospermum erythrorhizon]|uniref:Uncharacterized protein n=1 Tax=Lithospermum erythrorhizon TaxID=34254 RepID=A0AAV3R328_LITER